MHVGEYGDRPTVLGTPITWYIVGFFGFHFNDKMAIHGRKAILSAASRLRNRDLTIGIFALSFDFVIVRVARRKAWTGFWHCLRKDMMMDWLNFEQVILLESSDHVFAFVAFLLANPGLKPFVHTIVVTPAAFGPSLLYMLPNLASIECVDESQLEEPEDEEDELEDEDEEDEVYKNFHIVDETPPIYVRRSSLNVHHTSLACFRRLGAHIHTLRLHSVSFPTSLALAQVLLAFSSITHLVCQEVQIKTASNEAPLEVAKRRLSEQMRLKTLTIDALSMAQGVDGRAACPGALLFDSRLAPSTVESLRLIDVSRSDLRAYQSEWCRLQCLVLQLSKRPDGLAVDRPVELLEIFSNSPELREVTIEWPLQSTVNIVNNLSSFADESDPRHHTYKALKLALLTGFSQPRVTQLKCTIGVPVCANSLSFWARELEQYLPHSAVALECHEVVPAGHDAGVRALVISPDSKWVASGSGDSTVILWDTDSGAIVQRWVAHAYKSVRSLAFSPDSRYLVSGGGDGKAAIWDLAQDPRKVATLEGHAEAVRTCAWSPDGDAIATGSEDGTARLWDARIFRQRALVQLKGAVVCLAFSPNALWLACGSGRGECCILNVAFGTLHRSLWNSPSDDGDDLQYERAPREARDTVAAFDPSTRGSTRLATAPCGTCAGINVVDVETGIVLAHPGGKMGEFMHMYDVSFSPDGRLVLGVSATPRKAAYIWEASTGLELFQLRGHTHTIHKARFSPCGRFIASAAVDRTVRLWRTSDGSCVATFSEHKAAVEHVAFSPDGKTLSSGAGDGTVVIRHL
ncbi:WD40-repeat-containing domain protein [Ganoderma leucocontextum]|nr:WD40-repeat-containing domain protein [Ganoderma leucocontextum]